LFFKMAERQKYKCYKCDVYRSIHIFCFQYTIPSHNIITFVLLLLFIIIYHTLFFHLEYPHCFIWGVSMGKSGCFNSLPKPSSSSSQKGWWCEMKVKGEPSQGHKLPRKHRKCADTFIWLFHQIYPPPKKKKERKKERKEVCM